MITPDSIESRENMTWCYDIIISDKENDLISIEVIMDANTGVIYLLNYTLN